MFEFIQRKINHEKEIFTELSFDGRVLLICSTLNNFAAPFVGLFVNLYLWQGTHEVVEVGLYNLLFWIGLPIGFIVNGKILGHIKVNKLFQLGIFTQAIYPVFLLLLGENAFNFLYLLGFLNGFGAAFYWANINYLIYKSNSDKSRGYYSGLDSALGSMVGIVSPILAGVLVGVVGKNIFGWNLVASYRLIFVFSAFIFLLASYVAGKLTKNNAVFQFRILDLFSTKHHYRWLLARIIMFADGFIGGFFVLTGSVFAIKLLTGELLVGYFNGVLGVWGIIAGYFVARLSSPNRRIIGVVLSCLLALISSFVFGVTPAVIGFMIYSIIRKMSDGLIWTIGYTVVMKEMDSGLLVEEKKYNYIVDNEFFINLGRGVGLLSFFILYKYLGDQDSFTMSILLSWIPNIVIFACVYLLNKNNG